MSALTASTSSKIKIKPGSRKKKKDLDIYTLAIITRSVNISINNVGKNLKETLKDIIVNEIEGKCISEGYIKPNSVVITSYSNGVIEGYNINFQIVLECLVCNPVEGMHLTCIAKNITKAGIRAQLSDENNPIIIFIARDHNYMSKSFSAVQEDQEIKVRIIGKRFELNDTYISVIAELIEPRISTAKPKVKIITSNVDADSVSLIPITKLSPEPSSPQLSSKVSPVGSLSAPVAASPVGSLSAPVVASPVGSLSAPVAASPVGSLSAPVAASPVGSLSAPVAS